MHPADDGEAKGAKARHPRNRVNRFQQKSEVAGGAVAARHPIVWMSYAALLLDVVELTGRTVVVDIVCFGQNREDVTVHVAAAFR